MNDIADIAFWVLLTIGGGFGLVAMFLKAIGWSDDV